MIIQSNNLKALIPPLAQALYAPGSHPFDLRMIVIPEGFMKEQVLKALTEETKGHIAAGLTFTYLGRAIEKISGESLPTLLELSFFLETRLLAHINDPKFAAIKKYLEVEARTGPLSEMLSRIFWDYSLFGGKALSPWSQALGWQQLLWEEINDRWTLPHRLKVREKLQIVLFGFAYLPPLYLRFFAQAGALFFFFSPCQVFFADYASDRKKFFLEQREGVGATLIEQHKLLANLGKLGMSVQEAFEDLGGASEELFVTNQEKTLLSNFQRDLIEGEVNSHPQKDKTVHVFSAPTRLREVEVLKDQLLPLISQEKMKLEEVLIIAPDISKYAAALKSVFETTEYRIPLTIEGLPQVLTHSHARRLQELLDLVKERFAFEPLYQFLEGMPELSKEELSCIKHFAQKAHIRWGLSPKQKRALGGNEEQTGTWEEGLMRLSRGMAFVESSQEVSQIEWEILDQLVCILEAMERDLKPFWDREKRSVDVWAHIFLSIMKKYISPTIELSGEIRQLAYGFKEQGEISFESARRMVDHFLNQASRNAAGNHQTIKCVSLKEGLLWPHKVIAILGLEEGDFPKHEEKVALFDPKLESALRPKQNDRDRYLMLQLLLSAKEKLLMSYCHSQAPSCLILELRVFFQEAYALSLEIERHPFLPFDPCYFKKHSPLASYSKIEYRAAVLSQERSVQPTLIASFHQKQTSGPIEKIPYINLQKLEKFARNPLKFYLQEVLHISPQIFDTDLEQEEFILSGLKRHQLMEMALQSSAEEVIKISHAKGLFPTGNLGKLAEKNLRQAIEERDKQLEALAISKASLFKVVLHPYYRKWTTLRPQLFGAPPIRLKEGYEITGTLGLFSPQGLLHFGGDAIEDWVFRWPTFLAAKHFPQLKAKLLSLKKGKVAELVVKNPSDALVDYLNYFAKGKQMPSPLMPEWLGYFLTQEVESLEKELKKLEAPSQGVVVDPSWQWLLRRDPCPKADILIENWAQEAQRLFGGYFDI